MKVKQEYLLTYDTIELRRANERDNFKEIAKLIYETDKYIYPYWFNNNEEKAIEYLSKMVQEPKFIYYYENMYIAYDTTFSCIVGIVNAIDYTTELDYDYTDFKKTNERFAFVYKHYIKELIDLVKREKTMYAVNLCVSKNLRGKRIGSVLLGNFIKQMEKAGFDTIEFDCLLHNCRAKNLYHSLGFKEMYTGIGFNGKENPTYPEIVYFKRKAGDSLLDEFKFNDEYPKYQGQK